MGQASPCRNPPGLCKLFFGDVLPTAGSPARLDGAGVSHRVWQDKVPETLPLRSQRTVAGGCARIERVEEIVWDRSGPVGCRPMAGSETG